MSAIVEFLTARLAEDEQAASASGGDAWNIGLPAMTNPDLVTWPAFRTVTAPSRAGLRDHVCGSILAYDAAHIARHDPARVLADVAAKRAIVAEHRPYQEDPHAVAVIEDGVEWGVSLLCDACAGRKPSWPCLNLLALARVWADHPEFDPAWKVET